MNSINYWPILVSSVVSFGLGALWYSPILFGREWVELLKISDADMARMIDQGMWKRYVTQFILTLITFIVMAFAIDEMGLRTATDGAFVGLLAWLGFIIPVTFSGMLWKNESIKLVLIDAINYLVVLAIGGAIIGAWR